jgi:hypothetical protein
MSIFVHHEDSSIILFQMKPVSLAARLPAKLMPVRDLPVFVRLTKRHSD